MLIVGLMAKYLKEAQGILFGSWGDQSQLTRKQFIDSSD